MHSSLRERFAQLGPIRAVDRVPCGSPADFMLRLPRTQTAPKTIDAIMALARRGLPMLQAKRAIEACLEDGRIRVHLPSVEDHSTLRDDLAQAGFAITLVEAGIAGGRQIEIAGR